MSGPEAGQWAAAIQEEPNALASKWNVARRSFATRTQRKYDKVGNFERKLHAGGGVAKYEAGLIVRGFTQAKGESFVASSQPTMLRMLFRIAAEQDLQLEGMDVDNAYLNALVGEELHVPDACFL